MADLIVVEGVGRVAWPTPVPAADVPDSWLLTARAAELAERLAAVVERLDSADGAAMSTVAFLREWATQAREDRPTLRPRAQTSLDAFAAALDLTATEIRLVLLAGLAEEHEGLAGTFRSLHPLAEPHPTLGLAALVLSETGVDRAGLRRVVGEGAGVRLGVLRLTGPGRGPERSLTLADGIWDALHGVDTTPVTLRRRPLGVVPAGLDGWCATPLARRAAQLIGDRRPVTVVVTADDETVALSRCAALVDGVGAAAFPVRLGRRDGGDAVRHAVVHAAARDAVPVLVLDPPRPDREESGVCTDLPADVLDDAVRDVPVPVVVCTTTGAVAAAGDRPLLLLRAASVDLASRRLAWRATPPGADAATAADLADRLPLDPAWIAAVCADLRTAGRPREPTDAAAALRRRVGSALPAGAELVSPDAGWDRLVLPEEAGCQLRDAANRLTHQGRVLDDWRMAQTARARRGVRVLLTGLPGSGKSLAAEVLATAAGTDLLRVDLSQIVSKWLGETEQNLGAVFAAAERTRSVLLLDEADALFGTRTEIGDAHDRYANLQTAYLLQRLEAFDGLIVLTTNLRHNIDPAFLRRLDFVIEVPLPDEDARHALWRLHLPPELVDADVDLSALARMYPVPGGWIRNAALAAAFAAAAAAGDGAASIHRHHLISAVRREYAKAALPFPGEPPRRRDEN
jgi:hypothetical protein